MNFIGFSAGVSPARRWTAAMTVGAALLMGGCGGSDTPEVASAAPPGAPPVVAAASDDGGLAGKLATYIEGQRAWVKCMRKQGLDLPDPNAQGDVESPLLDKGPKSQKAAEACKKFYVPLPEDVATFRRPPLTAAQMAASKKFASCMREHGVADFPDPKPDEKSPPPKEELGYGAGAAYMKAQDICGADPALREAFDYWGKPAGG